MLKRTLFIENPCHVSSKLNQLVLRNKKSDEEKSVPIEDLGFVVFESEECTFSLQAIANLNANNVAVTFCNQQHMPTSMLLNLDSNTLQSQIFQNQTDASEPLKKQLWQQTVKAKILNQAALLKSLGKETAFMKRCASNVKSGDITNEEGKASRYYWSHLFDDPSTPSQSATSLRVTENNASTRPDEKHRDSLSMTDDEDSKSPVTLSEQSPEGTSESKSDDSLQRINAHPSTPSQNATSLRMTKRFTRDRDGEPPNNLLNYGYIVLRAGVARALTGSGLLPTLGIHHHNKYNAFCLADDIMEPYRPWVDLLVIRSIRDFKDISVLTTNIKTRLLTVLTLDVSINNSTSPLMVALSQTTASLAECFMGERKTIKYPEFTIPKSS